MKPNSSQEKVRSALPFRSKQRGFALVISLSLMVLLTVLAVGLLTLSSVSLRASNQSEAMQVARSNARMALSMAIGQLQRTAGADQRITASASIADDKTPIGFTGAWKSWERAEEGQDYNAKDSKFQGWLASSSLGNQTNDSSVPPHIDPKTAGAALLLGPGTLKGRDTDNGMDARMAVKPTLIEGSAFNGNLAWATIDESMKSRLSLSGESELPTPAKQIARAGSPSTDGVQSFEKLKDFEATTASVSRMITSGSADLEIGKDTMGPITPDLTVWSASLMTNPVEGGLKRDLSALASRPLSADEKTVRIFNDAGLATGEGDPYLSALTGYHNLYDKIGDTINSVRPSADGMAANIPSTVPDLVPMDFRTRALTPKPQSFKDPLLVPSVVRVDMIFSLIARDAHAGRAAPLKASGRPYMLHLMYLPVVTIHNPYNVPLTFDSMKVKFVDVPVGFQITINEQPLTTKLIPLNGLNNSSKGESRNSKEFGINLKASLSAASQTITLLPGQTKIFGTPKVPPSWRWQDESPGAGPDGVALFDYNEGRGWTKDFNMVPGLMTDAKTSCGFDVDWLTPVDFQTALGKAHGTYVQNNQDVTEGIVALKGNERIGVKFGPVAPTAAGNVFSIMTELKGSTKKVGGVRIHYQSEQRLKQLVEEGTSIRYPSARQFPEVYPKLPDDPIVTVATIKEESSTPISKYEKPDPFLIFSVSGKTTKESFVPSRPFADGSPTPQIAKIDFAAGKDPVGDAPMEMVMMPIRANTSAIEEIRNTNEGFFFGGHSAKYGSPRATFYEIPQMPLQSLAQLRHANLGSTGFYPFTTYTVGESMASPLMDSNAVKSTWHSDSSEMLDRTWLSNAALWDRYYLSTIAPYQGTAFGSRQKTINEVAQGFFEGEEKLLNARLTPLPSDKTDDIVSSLSNGDGWLLSAAHLMLEGGFNVNSTSVDAWTSVLSALRHAEMVTTDDGIRQGDKDEAAFPRVRKPVNGVITPGDEYAKRWQGFRSLNDAEVRTLAKNLVDEIRSRGPFLSLSEFVNRRLEGGGDDRSLRGALQAAIDRSGVNDQTGQDGMILGAANLGTHAYKTPQAAHGNNAAMAPGSLTQGDVLSVIGSFITPRGDTFAIRCYGDATDKKEGKVLARAWCEAIVQRTPNFVDSNDAPEKATSQLAPANKAFGRRFQVVSFRWLATDEV